MLSRIIEKLPYCLQFIASYFGGFCIIYLQFCFVELNINPQVWDVHTRIAFLALANLLGCVMSFMYRQEVKELKGHGQ